MKNNCIWQPGSIHGDEYYTLESVANQIADNMINIPKLKIWCPFNDIGSVWKGVLEAHGYEVVCTEGDFFSTEPPEGVQAIVSNPPFSIKKQVLERTRALGLRFVYILPFTWLNDSIPLEYGNQVMFWRKRMHFNTPGGDLNKPRSNCFALSDGLFKQDKTVVWE